jgi:hypothetical protein
VICDNLILHKDKPPELFHDMPQPVLAADV